MLVLFELDFEVQQILASDAPGAAYLKGGDNPSLAPTPDGHPAHPKISCHLCHSQQLIFPDRGFARGRFIIMHDG